MIDASQAATQRVKSFVADFAYLIRALNFANRTKEAEHRTEHSQAVGRSRLIRLLAKSSSRSIEVEDPRHDQNPPSLALCEIRKIKLALGDDA